MTRTFYAALAAPAGAAAATLVAWLLLGPGWALAVLAVSAAAIVVFHLWQLDLLARWAEGPLDAPVPEGRGSWRQPFTGLYRRVRTRVAVQRGLVQRLERFAAAAEAIPEGIVVLDDANRIRFANACASVHLGLDPERDLGQMVGNLVRQPEVMRYLEAGDFSEPVVVASQREPGVTLSIQVVPYGDEQKLLLSRDITRIEATARMRREFIANVSHELKTPLTVVVGLRRDAAGPRSRRAAAPALPGPRRRAGAQHAASRRRSPHAVGARERAEPAGRRDVPGRAAGRRARRAGAGALGWPAHDRRGSRRRTRPRSSPARATSSRARSATSCRTPSATRPTAARSRCRGASTTKAAGRSPSPTPVSASPPSTFPRLTERFYRVDRSRSRATGGTGSRPRDRPPRAAAAPGRARDRERARQGQHVRRRPARDARAADARPRRRKPPTPALTSS